MYITMSNVFIICSKVKVLNVDSIYAIIVSTNTEA